MMLQLPIWRYPAVVIFSLALHGILLLIIFSEYRKNPPPSHIEWFDLREMTLTPSEIPEKSQSASAISAVSKKQEDYRVDTILACGQKIFGENRVQEAKTKFAKIKKDNPKIELHLTGPLQSNKARDALLLFDVFHTVDREKIAKEFSKYQKLLLNKKFFVQINTGREKTKSGIFPEDVKDFLLFLKNEINNGDIEFSSKISFNNI